MWDCARGADHGSANQRGIYLLIGALLLCVLLYKAWGPLLIITLALVLVVHTCYSLLVNDSLLAPYTLVLLGYAKQIAWELAVTLRSLTVQGVRTFKELASSLGTHYDDWSRRQAVATADTAAAVDLDEDMSARHRRTYSLSTTGSELVNQVSPIVKDPYRTFAMNGACSIGRTSTPLPRGSTWKKDVQPNGDLELLARSSTPSIKKHQSTWTENMSNSSPSQLRTDESLYGPKGSPWAANGTPKLREKPVNVKTVQTIAGPLLASTRYNIDPKLYTDISSPGLTSRLTKYAAEASNRLTHQSQYGPGQFPKVNLNASPVPLLSPNVARARVPVTVRVAPPEIINYTPVDAHQERQKMSTNSSPQDLKETKSFPSVTKTLKKLPLKRHTSREDIMLDLAKKQRFERIFDGELENLEEMMQKRAREESIASDEDGSPQSKNERPLKRPKASSCHDVINSLSSSVNVYTGIKRKAMDTSRCSTPNTEKHFKPSTISPTRSSSLTLSSSRELARSKEQLNVKVPVINTIKVASPEKPKKKSPEVTKHDGLSLEKPNSQSPDTLNLPTPKVRREIPIPTAIKPSVKLTDKLFMRAEPQANEKIKSLIEEQGKVEAKFTTDDKEEIKKEDIVNMRQNSMRLRLQSMFDAISGKSSKIDPDVVIQAEEINLPSSTSSYTVLSSQTSTTTVNTSPITTTIVPILKTDTESKSPTNKHVTFNLPSSLSSLSSTDSSLSTAEVTKPAEAKLPTSVPNFNFGSNTSATPTFNFGSNASTTVSTTAPMSTTTSSFSFPVSNGVGPITTSKVEVSAAKTTASSSISTTLFTVKPTTVATGPTLSSTGFSFGTAAAKAATSASAAVSSVAPATSFSMPSSIANTTEMSLGGVTSTPTFGNALTKSPACISLAQTTTSLPSFGGDKKEPSFAFGALSSAPNIGSTTANNQPSSIFSSTTTMSSTATTTNSMFSAGSNNNPPPAYSAATAITTSAPPATSMFNFGTTSKPSGSFSFGASTGPTATTTANTLSPTFGSGTAVTGFGTPATASNPSTTTSAPAFGTTAATSIFGAQTNAPSLFSGASSTTTASTTMFKSPSAPAAFGTPQPATTTPATTSIFGAQSNTPSFGALQSTISTPSLFGNTAASPPNPASLFGNTPTTTTTAPPPAFGSTQQQSSIFSGASATTTGTTSIFGATASAPAPSGGLFSGSIATNRTPTANPADTGSIFGQAKSPTSISFGRSTSAFGSTAASSSFPAPNVTSPSAFGVPSSTTSGSLPAFSSIKPTPQFGTPAATQSSVSSPGTSVFGSTPSGSTFGANPTASFGANTKPASAFGSTSSTSNAFSMPSTSANAPAFGASSPPSFGSTGSNATSPFGAPQPATTTTPSLFGNAAPAGTSAAGPSANSTFSFGGSQPAQPVVPQPTGGSFSFGSTAPSGGGGGSGVFQFGAASSASKPAGFNFNAPTSAPQINFTGNTAATPAFNAPAPNFQAPGANMFSIGSGSSTPRSRTSRARRQR